MWLLIFVLLSLRTSAALLDSNSSQQDNDWNQFNNLPMKVDSKKLLSGIKNAVGVTSLFLTEVWAAQVGSSGSDIFKSVVRDYQGNTYAAGTGYFDSSTNGIILVKYDNVGQTVWSVKFDTFENPIFGSIAIAQSGSLFIVASDSNSINSVIIKLEPQFGEEIWSAQCEDCMYSTVIVDPYEDIFVGGNIRSTTGLLLAKYSSDGTLKWSYTYLDSSDCTLAKMTSIAVDMEGSIVGVGYVTGDCVVASQGSNDAILIKFSVDGDLLLSTQFGSSGDDSAYGVVVDNDNNYYITGATDGALYADSAGNYDTFLLKVLGADLSTVFEKQYGTAGTDMAYAIALNQNKQIAYIGGSESGAFAIRSYDITTGKLIYKINVASNTFESSIQGLSVAASAGEIYVVGYTKGALFSDDYVAEEDAFVVKFSDSFDPYTIYPDPTVAPTSAPTEMPTLMPTEMPTVEPTVSPTLPPEPDGMSLDNVDKIWAVQLGTSALDTFESVQYDNLGNVYVAGVGNQFGTARGIIVAKFNSIGEIIWGKNFNDWATQNVQYGSMILSLGRVVIVCSDSAGSSFVKKLDLNGDLTWSYTINNSTATRVITNSLGDIYVGGTDTSGTASVKLTKLSSAGVFQSSESFATDTCNVARVLGMAFDVDGNILMSGFVTGDCFGDIYGGFDAFWIKVSTAGTLLYSEQFGTSGNDAIFSIAVDADNNYYMTGATAGNLYNTSFGNDDILLMKIRGSDHTSVWRKQVGTSSFDNIYAIQLNAKRDALYICGLKRITPTSGLTLQSYSMSTGDFRWKEQSNVQSYLSNAVSIAVDTSTDTIYMAGFTAGALFNTNAGAFDAYVVKLVEKPEEVASVAPSFAPTALPNPSLLYDFPLLSGPLPAELRLRKSNLQFNRFSGTNNKYSLSSVQLIGRGRGITSTFTLTGNFVVWTSYYMDTVTTGPSLGLSVDSSTINRIAAEHAEGVISIAASVSATAADLATSTMKVGEFYTVALFHHATSAQTIALWYTGRDLTLEQFRFMTPLARLQVNKVLSGPIRVVLNTAGTQMEWVQFMNCKIQTKLPTNLIL